MHLICLRGVFTRKAEGRLYAITGNSDMVTQIRCQEGDFALLGSDKFDELEDAAELGYEVVGKLACRFVLAAPEDGEVSENLQVATSYPRAFQKFLASTGIQAQISRQMPGKVESAPERGFANAIFDITQTGESLCANKLRVIKGGEQLQLGGLWLTDNKELDDLDMAGYLASLQTIMQRKQALVDGKLPTTYTEQLLDDVNERVKKLSSESGELVREMCRPDFGRQRFIGEASDLVYAVEVACAAQGISFIQVLNELANRNNQ